MIVCSRVRNMSANATVPGNRSRQNGRVNMCQNDLARALKAEDENIRLRADNAEMAQILTDLLSDDFEYNWPDRARAILAKTAKADAEAQPSDATGDEPGQP